MKKKLLLSLLSFSLFIVMIILLRTVDLEPIGPNGSLVGFASINEMFHNLTGVNFLWYEITDALGILAILVCVVFGFIGFIQWVKRKKLFAVDREIIALGILFIITIGLYVLFTFVAVNYRPVIMPGETELEPSFPSSHTMLAVVVFGSVSIIISKYIKDKKISSIIKIVLNSLLIIAMVGRLLSGVHWFTDIISSCIISYALLQAYQASIQ